MDQDAFLAVVKDRMRATTDFYRRSVYEDEFNSKLKAAPH
jgi:hypothetical protein